MRIEDVLENYKLEKIITGKSGSQVFLCTKENFPSFYYKTSCAYLKQEAIYESKVLEWIKEFIVVPKVIISHENDDCFYSVLSMIEGENCKSIIIDSNVVASIAKILKLIHQLPKKNCPFSFELKKRILLAQNNLSCGFVDLTDFDESRKGIDPQVLLSEIVKDCDLFIEDIVVAHGDFSLANIIVKNKNVEGVVDWGRAGLADRYQDLAIIFRGLKISNRSEFECVFLENYHLIDVIDYKKIEFYQKLDEFF